MKFIWVAALLSLSTAALAQTGPSQARIVVAAIPGPLPIEAGRNPLSVTEVARIGRMTCKDFLWEYDVMKQIAGKRSLIKEKLLSTSLAMFVVEKKVDAAGLKQLNRNFDQVVRDSVATCREKPDENYWRGVLAPVARLER